MWASAEGEGDSREEEAGTCGLHSDGRDGLRERNTEAGEHCGCGVGGVFEHWRCIGVALANNVQLMCSLRVWRALDSGQGASPRPAGISEKKLPYADGGGGRAVWRA